MYKTSVDKGCVRGEQGQVAAILPCRQTYSLFGLSVENILRSSIESYCIITVSHLLLFKRDNTAWQGVPDK